MKLAKGSLIPVAAVALATAAGGWLVHPWALLPLGLVLLFTIWFFRDPERVPPDDACSLVSPADGRVIRAHAGIISVFMSPLDVHVCRCPVEGSLESVKHVPGRFVAAYRDAAAEQNERAVLQLSGPGGTLSITLVAGLLARRIVLWVTPGQHLERGQRIGLIRFGSRVDLALPEGGEPAVRIGDRVRAGETVIAVSRGRSPRASKAAPFPL